MIQYETVVELSKSIWDKTKTWTQKASESGTACAVAMVGGDLTVFSIKHALVAAKTGSIAATVYVISAGLFGVQNRFAQAWLIAMATMCVDMVVHSTHYGNNYTEALYTGLGAGFIALMMSGFLYRGK